jgi:hypothetical protein
MIHSASEAASASASINVTPMWCNAVEQGINNYAHNLYSFSIDLAPGAQNPAHGRLLECFRTVCLNFINSGSTINERLGDVMRECVEHLYRHEDHTSLQSFSFSSWLHTNYIDLHHEMYTRNSNWIHPGILHGSYMRLN